MRPGWPKVDPESLPTTAPGVFVAGDLAHGTRLLIDAVASGKAAARSIYRAVTGNSLSPDTLTAFLTLPGYRREKGYESIRRVAVPVREPGERLREPDALVELGYDHDQAMREASRCLACGVTPVFDGTRCVLCGGCADVCPTLCLKLVSLGDLEPREELRSAIEKSLGTADDASQHLVSGGEAGTSREEDRRFVEWCVDEAGGKVGVTLNLRYYTLEDNIEMARYAEAVGCNSVMISYPTNFRPRSEEDIYGYTKAICDATGLGVILFPSVKNDFPAPYRVSARTLARLADLENVIAMKFCVLEWTWFDECFRLFGERLLISYPFDDAWPTMIRRYGMQWSGAAPWHNYQTAANPRSVRMFNLIRDGRMDEAIDDYKNHNIWKAFLISQQVALLFALVGLFVWGLCILYKYVL